MNKKHKGSTFESFLDEEGLADGSEAIALKRVIAYQIEKAMQKEKLTKTTMALKMKTSRSALDRLLDPENTSITLITLTKAARVLGKKLKLSLG